MRVELVRQPTFDDIFADADFVALAQHFEQHEPVRRFVPGVIRIFWGGLRGPDSITRYASHWARQHRAADAATVTAIDDAASLLTQLYGSWSHRLDHLRGAMVEGLVETRLRSRYAQNTLANNVTITVSNGVNYTSSTTADVVGWDGARGECHDCKVRAKNVDVDFLREMEAGLLHPSSGSASSPSTRLWRWLRRCERGATAPAQGPRPSRWKTSPTSRHFSADLSDNQRRRPNCLRSLSITAIILDFGSIATAVGVGVGVIQLRSASRQAVSEFEDSLTQLYRALVAEFPVEAFLDEPISTEDLMAHRSTFYRYFDLCNEQVFLRMRSRVTPETWEQWRDGIKTNLGRVAFAVSWTEHFERQTDGDFRELRRLMLDYDSDPATWRSATLGDIA